MTADLVAEAIALCETISEFAMNEVDDWEINLRSSPDNGFWKDQLVIATGIYRLATTHLAEFEEHERTGYSEQETDEDFCEKCEGPYQKNILYPCDFITTKAKRLLGKE